MKIGFENIEDAYDDSRKKAEEFNKNNSEKVEDDEEIIDKNEEEKEGDGAEEIEKKNDNEEEEIETEDGVKMFKGKGDVFNLKNLENDGFKTKIKDAKPDTLDNNARKGSESIDESMKNKTEK